MNGIETLLAELAVKATALLSAAAMATVVMRRAPASARHLVWTCAATAVLLLPCLSLMLPAWRPLPAMTPAAVRGTAFAATPGAAAGPLLSETVSAAPHSPVATPGPGTWLTVAWLGGMLAVLARAARGWVRLRTAARRARNFDSPVVNEVLALGGTRSDTRVCVSADVPVPIATGVARGMILLPEEALQWSPERLRAVLLHERMHLDRRDVASQWAAELACALYWFHPLAWWMAHRMRVERERATDDAVLRLGFRPSDYADHLLALAAAWRATAAPEAAAAAGMASQLEDRVRSILDHSRNRRAVGVVRGLAAAVLCAAVVLPVSAFRGGQGGGAQGPVGALHGAVVDSSGARVPKARVIAKFLDNGAARPGTEGTATVVRGRQVAVVSADAAGEFTMTGVPLGQYEMVVRAAGFKELRQSTKLETPVSAPLELRLSLGEVNEEMTVVGSRPSPAPAPAPSPSPSAAPARIQVGGNVQATRLVKHVRVSYPDAAKARGAEGTVVIRAVISVAGDLLNAEVETTSIDPDLAEAALAAVRQWRYTPTLLNGKPVEVVTNISINFRLED